MRLNPPTPYRDSASLNYWVGMDVDEAEIRITDSEGTLVRTLPGSTDRGINRVWWDLRGEPSTEIRLRTTPLYADWVDFNDDRWRPAPRTTRVSYLMPPGTYTVTLNVGDQEFSTQLTVLKDPNSEGSEADILLQTDMLADLKTDFNEAAELVNRIEWIRRQLYDTRAVLEGQGLGDEVASGADDLDTVLIEVEEQLIQLRSTGTGQDYVRNPAKLVSAFEYLAGIVASADFPPTDQAQEVQVLLKERLETARAGFQAILDGDLEEFNRLLQSLGTGNIIAMSGWEGTPVPASPTR